MNTSKSETKRTAFYILLTYMVYQLSVFLLIIPPLQQFFLQFMKGDEKYALQNLFVWWNVVTGILALIVAFLLIRRHPTFFQVFQGEKASIPVTIGWGIIGYFMVMLGQMIGVQIEAALGITAGSDNTELILTLAKISPIMIVSAVIIAPIFEELVFRRVIFGSLIQTQNFWVAGIISAIVFALIHNDFTHIILYTITGFIFAFIYYKTKRLLASIIAHFLWNGMLMLIQLNYDRLQSFYEQVPK